MVRRLFNVLWLVVILWSAWFAHIGVTAVYEHFALQAEHDRARNLARSNARHRIGLAKLEDAFLEADKAGDADEARRLAKAILRMRRQAPPKREPRFDGIPIDSEREPRDLLTPSLSNRMAATEERLQIALVAIALPVLLLGAVTYVIAPYARTR